MNQPIVITGFMAAGKTTVALALARLLGCRFVDLDQLVAKSQQRSAGEIIEQDGELSFREVETRHLRLVLGSGSDLVIALGGGAWMTKENRDLLAAHNCFSVWLDAPFDLCWQRISSGEIARPLAANEEQAHRLYEERRHFYRLAAFHLSVDHQTRAEDLAMRIVAARPKAG